MDTILWICGGLIAAAGMIFAALKQGEKTGRQKEQLKQAQEAAENEKARKDIDSAVRRMPSDKLRDGYYRD